MCYVDRKRRLNTNTGANTTVPPPLPLLLLRPLAFSNDRSFVAVLLPQVFEGALNWELLVRRTECRLVFVVLLWCFAVEYTSMGEV